MQANGKEYNGIRVHYLILPYIFDYYPGYSGAVEEVHPRVK